MCFAHGIGTAPFADVETSRRGFMRGAGAAASAAGAPSRDFFFCSEAAAQPFAALRPSTPIG